MKWTPAHLEALRTEYPNTNTKVLAKRLERSDKAVHIKALSLGLRKSPEYLASAASTRMKRGDSRGAQYWFTTGNQPWNKGRRYQAGGRSVEARFKPGNMPQTWRPIGSERVDRDGIRWRKVADTRDKKTDWRPIHILVWEEANGPLADGVFLVFANKDRSDVRLENLLPVTRSELMERNTFHRFPPSLKRAIRAVRKLERTIEVA